MTLLRLVNGEPYTLRGVRTVLEGVALKPIVAIRKGAVTAYLIMMPPKGC